MTAPIAARFTARIDGDFVVFLIGMRINRPLMVARWWPVFTAMPRMIRELEAAGPDSGFLGHTPVRLGVMVQYWRSFEQLERYARATSSLHWPAWIAFNRRARNARGDVGIWHETYRIRAGDYECVYSGMPPWGLSAAAELVRLDPRREGSARERLDGTLG